MEKQEYINLAKNQLKGDAFKFAEGAINAFYELSGKTLKNDKYKVGDFVTLKKNTYMHGFGYKLEILDNIAQNGLISQDYEIAPEPQKVTYAVSLWHIKRNIKLKDYIINYSGMSVEYDNDLIMVPYKQFDNFIEKVRKDGYWSLRAESSMETRFMPSLAKDSNKLQLALILNGRDKECKQLNYYNLLNEEVPLDTVLNFMKIKNPKFAEMFKKNRQNYEDKRIAYLMFGLPVNTIEGVLVGRKYEKNKKILNHIKQVLPNSYICNLDGKVIVE